MSHDTRPTMTNVEPTTCGRRMNDWGPWTREENIDHWQTGRWAATRAAADAEVAAFLARTTPGSSMGDPMWRWGAVFDGGQPRTCSFCGGIHPDDAVALIKAGWEVGATDKGYKRYLEPPGYRASLDAFSDWHMRFHAVETDAPRPETVGSPLPPVKLYVQHFTPEQIEAFNDALAKRGGQ